MVIRHGVIGALSSWVDAVLDYMSVELAVLCFYEGKGTTMGRSPASGTECGAQKVSKTFETFNMVKR